MRKHKRKSWADLYAAPIKCHCFKLRDPCGPPLGLGLMSARDAWRYDRSMARFRARFVEPKPLLRGEIGQIDEFRIILV